jgi:hypothetical protein
MEKNQTIESTIYIREILLFFKRKAIKKVNLNSSDHFNIFFL